MKNFIIASATLFIFSIASYSQDYINQNGLGSSVTNTLGTSDTQAIKLK